MAKRKKQRNKKVSEKMSNQQVSEQHEETIEKPKEAFLAQKNIVEKVEKIVEKVKVAPQTYTEDTFDLENQNTVEIVLENKIDKKYMKQISKEDLYELYSFKTKMTKIKSKVESEKGFGFLLDFVTATKMYRRFYIDETTDEFDLILYEVVLHFNKRLSRITLTYKVYQEIIEYFENLKSLYGQFKHAELVEEPELVKKLKDMNDKADFIKHYLF